MFQLKSKGFFFQPIAFETMGVWGPSTQELIRDLSQRISTQTGEPRVGEFLRQRISIEIQRGNAMFVRGRSSMTWNSNIRQAWPPSPLIDGPFWSFKLFLFLFVSGFRVCSCCCEFWRFCQHDFLLPYNSSSVFIYTAEPWPVFHGTD